MSAADLVPPWSASFKFTEQYVGGLWTLAQWSVINGYNPTSILPLLLMNSRDVVREIRFFEQTGSPLYMASYDEHHEKLTSETADILLIAQTYYTDQGFGIRQYRLLRADPETKTWNVFLSNQVYLQKKGVINVEYWVAPEEWGRQKARQRPKPHPMPGS